MQSSFASTAERDVGIVLSSLLKAVRRIGPARPTLKARTKEVRALSVNLPTVKNSQETAVIRQPWVSPNISTLPIDRAAGAPDSPFDRHGTLSFGQS